MTSAELIKEAGMVDTIVGKIKSEVASAYDPSRPVESVLSFVGPGVLWKLGFPWLAVIYEIMGALGFSWKDFWEKVKDELKSLLTSAKDKTVDKSQIESIVHNSVSSSFSGTPDNEKLQDLAKKYSPSAGGENMANDFNINASINECVQIRKFAIQNQFANEIYRKRNIKTAGLLSMIGLKGGGFITKLVVWVISAILISAGFKVAGAALSGAVESVSGDKPTDSNILPASVRDRSIQVSENVDPSLLQRHPNTINSIWIENFSINDIDNKLISWTLNAYPQLRGHEQEILGNSVFQQIVNLFEQRNKMATNLEIISVPKPYERKIDIVNTFAPQVIRNLNLI
jgi:hypothetical protein